MQVFIVEGCFSVSDSLRKCCLAANQCKNLHMLTGKASKGARSMQKVCYLLLIIGYLRPVRDMICLQLSHIEEICHWRDNKWNTSKQYKIIPLSLNVKPLFFLSPQNWISGITAWPSPREQQMSARTEPASSWPRCSRTACPGPRRPPCTARPCWSRRSWPAG